MMFRLLLFIAVLMLLSWGGAWLLENHGVVTIAWLGYEATTTVAFLIAVVVSLLFTLMVMIQCVLWVFSLPERRRYGQAQHRMDKAFLSLSQGFAALAVGDEKKAVTASQNATKLLKGNRYGEHLALILSAETNQLSGNVMKAEQHFTALLPHKSTEVLALQGLLVSAQQQGNIPKAVEYAEKIYALHPESKGITRMLLNLYKRTARWEEAERFLEKRTRRTRFSLNDAPLEIDMAQERAIIATMRARELIADPKAAFKKTQEALKFQPDFFPAVELAVQYAEKAEQHKAGRRIVEQFWVTTPTSLLGEAYLGLLAQETPKARIKAVLKLIEKNPNHAESHALAARTYLEAGEAQAAKNHAMLAVAVRESADNCTLMAECEETLAESTVEIAQWHSRAEHARANAGITGWECRECHMPTEHWNALCPACNAVDALVWVSPYGRHTVVAPITKGVFTKLDG